MYIFDSYDPEKDQDAKVGDTLEGDLTEFNMEKETFERGEVRLHVTERDGRYAKVFIERRKDFEEALKGRGPAKYNSEAYRKGWDKINWNGTGTSQEGQEKIH